MPYLATELMEKIFDRCDAKTRLQFRLVCKEFRGYGNFNKWADVEKLFITRAPIVETDKATVGDFFLSVE